MNKIRKMPAEALLRGVCAVLVLVSATAQAQSSRDYVSVVGSSTVYPFATAVAENFGRSQRRFKTPKVEQTGTGGGIKLFCSGVGVSYPDIVTASRRIKQSELDNCSANGVREVVEVKIGFDGIVLVNAKSAPTFKVTRRDLFLALAKQVPGPKGGDKLIANPYRTWRDIESYLPAERIEVLGPPPTSGTRDAFTELVLEPGCASFAALAALQKSDERRFKEVCHTIREDGAYVEAGENDNLIVQKLSVNPRALGIFGYSFLEQNLDKMHGSLIEGVVPTYESIADGKYPGARALYIYVKKAHAEVIPGLPQYIAEFTSNRAMGEDGYLADKGLVSLPAAERARVRAQARSLKVLPAKL
ncbi:MAG TPA: substrate-binding domain-containing protein [Steroidobacteraceae bacterium]|mgnify:CR=1 FL=1|nr:substrate-binding domain-containing protein [Steroidobacteraceae bacterium]HRX88864.1 substrate-binding domain-containing protein [Steroidobacteraceae bacterium]